MPILVGRIALIAVLVTVTIVFIIVLSAVPAMGITILDKKIRRLPTRSHNTFWISFFILCGLVTLGLWAFLFT
ncbi:MAG: hypothetical protein CL886_04125 [Dehalococcoidia bacterium]|nr:hypothetical protein [Dehalococcoidia bacterium]